MAESQHPRGKGGTATVVVTSVDDYVALMTTYLTRQISAHDFERRYLDLFRDDATERPEPPFRVLNDLFFAVDAFCLDPALRDAHDLDENQLRASVRAAIHALTT